MAITGAWRSPQVPRNPKVRSLLFDPIQIYELAVEIAENGRSQQAIFSQMDAGVKLISETLRSIRCGIYHDMIFQIANFESFRSWQTDMKLLSKF